MEEGEEDRRNPLWVIIAAFLALILVVGIVPVFLVSHNPWPRNVPSLDELEISYGASPNRTSNRGSYNAFLTPGDPLIKVLATRIASLSCPESIVCHARAMYEFVQGNFAYVSEYDDYVMLPVEMLSARGGDCDDHAVLLASLLRAVGIPTRFVHVPGHIYVEAYLPDAPEENSGWVSLDATCRTCAFGQVMPRYMDAEKRYS